MGFNCNKYACDYNLRVVASYVLFNVNPPELVDMANSNGSTLL